MQWIQFYSQHRKYGYSIILVAQFDKMLDRQIRSLLEYEYMHRKVSNFGVVGWLMSLVCGGKAHVCIQRYYPLNQRLGAKWFIARKKIFDMYDSFGDFAQMDGQALGGQTQGNAPARAGAADSGPVLLDRSA